MQLLDNLLSNAIKFTPQGGRIEVRVERTLSGAAVEVLDTGVGIEAGEEERIFERFYRSASAITEHVQGTGLGLFIARAIAERHGGTPRRPAPRRRRKRVPARAARAGGDPGDRAEPELVA